MRGRVMLARAAVAYNLLWRQTTLSPACRTRTWPESGAWQSGRVPVVGPCCHSVVHAADAGIGAYVLPPRALRVCGGVHAPLCTLLWGECMHACVKEGTRVELCSRVWRWEEGLCGSVPGSSVSGNAVCTRVQHCACARVHTACGPPRALRM